MGTGGSFDGYKAAGP